MFTREILCLPVNWGPLDFVNNFVVWAPPLSFGAQIRWALCNMSTRYVKKCFVLITYFHIGQAFCKLLDLCGACWVSEAI